MLSSFLTPSLVFLLTLGFGAWLSRAGRPYNGLLFNLHKLVALGAVILTGMQAVNALRAVEAGGLVTALLAAAGIGALALFASGAFMSAGRLDHSLMKRIHNLAPFVAVPALAAAVYLLAENAP